MNVLLIGGSGNISYDVAGCLLERGDDVWAVTRGGRPLPAGCRAVVCDRHDRRAMQAALRSQHIDVVVNFLGFDIPDLQVDLDVFRDRIDQYIFISSATVYAKPHLVLPLTEAAPVGNRFSDYAQHKRACEEWLRAREVSQHFPVTIVRPSHTYSPSWIPNPVQSAGYTFAARLRAGKPVFVHDGGESLWTLTAASDFAVGLAGLVGNPRALGETFHLTSDEALSWKTIYDETASAFGVSDPEIVSIPTAFICASNPDLTAKLKGDKAVSSVFDNRKIKSVVPGFACRKPFRDGIREVAAWFDADPARQTVDPAVDGIFDHVIADWQQFKG